MADGRAPSVDVTLPEVTQVGFVVRDLESAMRRFGRLFGIEPWLVYRFEPPRLTDTTYRGEPGSYSMRVALTDVEGPIDHTSDHVGGGTLSRAIRWLTAVRDRFRARSEPADRTARSGERASSGWTH